MLRYIVEVREADFPRPIKKKHNTLDTLIKVVNHFFSIQELHIFLGNSIFHPSLELLTKFWKTSLKTVNFIVDFTRFSEN